MIDFKMFHRIASENLLHATHAKDAAEARKFLGWAKTNEEKALALATNRLEQELGKAVLLAVTNMEAAL